MKSRKIISLGVVMLLILSLAMVLAIALEAKPVVYVEPNTIEVNKVVNIHVKAEDPPGDDPSVPNDFLYMDVHQVVVRYPADSYTEEFMLGTISGPGIGSQKIRVEYGEDIAIPFGTPMTGVAITIKGNTYYWWRTRKAGNPVSPNEMGASTEWTGKYEADVEGRAYYGSSEQEIRLRKFFDIPDYFWVTVPEFGLTAAAVSLVAYWAVLRKRKLKN
ncbi:MAG: hypothetical protein QXU67_06115 [Candidatus Bathyarchaeia archaeon]